MGKVVKIDKSRKEFRCSKCGEVIPKDGEEDYDTIFENNETLQEQMAEDFTDMLSSEIESALEYIEV